MDDFVERAGRTVKEKVNNLRDTITMEEWNRYQNASRADRFLILSSVAKRHQDTGLANYLIAQSEKQRETDTLEIADGGDLELRKGILETAFQQGPSKAAIMKRTSDEFKAWFLRNYLRVLWVPYFLLSGACLLALYAMYVSYDFYFAVVFTGLVIIASFINLVVFWTDGNDYDYKIATKVWSCVILVLFLLFGFVGTLYTTYRGEVIFVTKQGVVTNKIMGIDANKSDRTSDMAVIGAPGLNSTISRFDINPLLWRVPATYQGVSGVLEVSVEREFLIQIGDGLTMTPAEFEQETNYNIVKQITRATLSGDEAISALQSQLNKYNDTYRIAAQVEFRKGITIKSK